VIPRHQLAVAPRIAAASVMRAATRLASPGRSVERARAGLRRSFGAGECIPTDSGTSALILALRVAVGTGGVVALPAYGCIDFASAVQYAGVRVRLYDVDPMTMSPDLDSVSRLLHRGVSAIVVAHFYGYPADVTGVRELAARFGVAVIEDAAQAAGGMLRGRRLGGFGDLSVLSFGRGKGLFGGNGGALLAFSPPWTSHLARLPALATRRGLRDVLDASIQWALGRPRLYALPASIPWLRLGDMVYHAAAEPQALSGAAAALLQASMADEEFACTRRRLTAHILRTMTERLGSGLVAVPQLPRAEPGFLRFAVLDRSERRTNAPRLGIMRGYPRILREQPELAKMLVPGEPATPGATELRDALFTLPTHDMVDDRDLLDLQGWIIGSGARLPQVSVAAVQRRHVHGGVLS
jgi:dTDP-4-amino-4,6-dideoxygalactose transaminase